jgi:hypothetical protein
MRLRSASDRALSNRYVFHANFSFRILYGTGPPRTWSPRGPAKLNEGPSPRGLISPGTILRPGSVLRMGVPSPFVGSGFVGQVFNLPSSLSPLVVFSSL